MIVYIIEYRRLVDSKHRTIDSKISQEGYATIEAAQAIIERKPNKPTKVSQMLYITDGTEEYIIHDIQIMGEREAVTPPQPRLYEHTCAAVYATGNRWAIKNFNATHGNEDQYERNQTAVFPAQI